MSSVGAAPALPVQQPPWYSGSLSLHDTLTLTRLLARLSLPPSREPPKGVRELVGEMSPDGTVLDYYEPEETVRGAVVAVHGVTVNGRRDDRLIHFARSLASVGVACAVPTLSRLAACQWHPSDVDSLGGVVDALSERAERRPGLIGFSHGASYALVLASRPSHAQRIRFVLGFGPYFALDELLEDYAATRRPSDDDTTALEDWLYLHFALAHGIGAPSSLTAEVRRELAQLLHKYCHDSNLQEKKRFFEEHIARIDILKTALKVRDLDMLRAVSPAGKLEDVRCPVSLVHDVHDTMVPPQQSRLIFDALQKRRGNARQTLLVTNLLSHVALRDALRLGEVGKLLAALRPIVLAD